MIPLNWKILKIPQISTEINRRKKEMTKKMLWIWLPHLKLKLTFAKLSIMRTFMLSDVFKITASNQVTNSYCQVNGVGNVSFNYKKWKIMQTPEKLRWSPNIFKTRFSYLVIRITLSLSPLKIGTGNGVHNAPWIKKLLWNSISFWKKNEFKKKIKKNKRSYSSRRETLWMNSVINTITS